MNLPIGYLRVFSKLYGIRKGMILYYNLKFGKLSNLKIPELKNSFQLRDNDVDFKVFCQIFINKEYEFKLKMTPNRIIDAGANIGLFSLFINSKYPNAQICAIEPDSENFELLTKNLSCIKNKIILNNALWSKVTNLDISDPFNSGKWAMMVSENDSGSVQSIDVDSLLEILEWDTIDLFKIDIEGSERNLFESNYSSWLPKTKIIVIELHDWMSNDCTKVFFNSLNECVKNYSMSIHGENLVITNNDLI